MYIETQATWLQWTASETEATTLYTQCQHVTGHAITVANESLATAWFSWVGEQEENAEQRQHRRAAQAAAQQRQRDIEAVRRAASERAESLLTRCLTTAQRGELASVGWFMVVASSGRRYQIRRGRVRNVIEVDFAGKRLRTYCCHPADHVPDADTMLAQKLMLEMSEDEFLRLANVS
jgi:hypothetical protein